MSMFVTDTHPLLWYAANERRKLSRKALRTFERAWDDQALIYIPAAVLWETALLIKIGEVKLSEPFDLWAAALSARKGFEVIPHGVEDMIADMHVFITTRINDDPFDEMIVATASNLDLPLITADSDITDSQIVETLW